MSNQKEVKLIIDIREQSLYNELLALPKLNKNAMVSAELKQLEIGDVLASDETVIERKTRMDFEASIIDNRLFMQLTEMQKYKNRILIIEGTDEFQRLSRQAVMGCYGAVIAKYGTSLIFTRDLYSTAEIVYYVAKQAQDAKDVLKLVAEKRTVTSSNSTKVRRVVESFPMIGPINAVSLLQEFGTIKRIINATKSELVAASHIGKLKAQALLELFNYNYKKEEDNCA